VRAMQVDCNSAMALHPTSDNQRAVSYSSQVTVDSAGDGECNV